MNAPTSASPHEASPSLRPLLESCLEWSVLLLSLLCGFLALWAVPLLGKTLLPVGLGAPGDWLGCLLLVQVCALAGAFMATRLESRPLLSQLAAMGFWAFLAILVCELVSMPTDIDLGRAGMLARLFLKLGLPIALMTGIPLLLGGWLLPSQRRSSALPPILFAAGGACSLAVYPLWIESVLTLGDQALFWEFCLILVSFLSMLVCLLRRSFGGAQEALPRKPLPLMSPVWTAFATNALSAALLFATTELLAQELGTSAFVCGLPLCLQLLASLCVLAGWLPGKASRIGLGLVLLSLAGYLLTRGIGSAPLQGARLGWLLLLSGSAGLLGTGAMVESSGEAGRQGLSLQLGSSSILGAAAALFVIPRIIAWPGDILIYAGALGVLGLCELFGRRKPAHIAGLTLLCALPIAAVCPLQSKLAQDEHTRSSLRNAHGLLVAHEGGAGVVLSTQSTTLATQITQTKEARGVATLYASQSSALGLSITAYQTENQTFRLAVIGLSGGTLASYARPEDSFRFWESNPAMIDLSQHKLSYLRDCKGHCEVEEANGRQELVAGSKIYDMIVINSIQGDAPPSYLLTQEALLGYASKLSPRGLVIVHNSSRFHDAYPALWSTAQQLGWQAIRVRTEVTEAGNLTDYDPCVSDYVIIGRPGPLGRLREFLGNQPSLERVKRTILESPPRRQTHEKAWSDGINSPFASLQLERLLQGQE